MGKINTNKIKTVWRQFIADIEILLWLLGLMYLNLFRFNFHEVKINYAWLKIHLTHDGKFIGKVKISKKQHIKNRVIQCFSLIVTYAIIYSLYKIIIYIKRIIWLHF